MFRIDDPSAAAALPTPETAGTEAYFTEGLPGTTPATLVRASWLNMIQEELRAIVVAGGGTPSKTTYNQVLAAINKLIEAKAGDYALDTGAANAYVVALSPAVTSYTNGLQVKFRVVNANTGASTLNAGAGAVSLKNDLGNALVSGDLPAGAVVTAIYDATATAFLITTLVPSQAISQAAADARYAQLTGIPSIQGAFKNLQASASGTSATVSVSADEIVVENSSNAYQTLRAVSLSIAGTSSGVANGLDTGTLAINTWYSLWVIWNGTTTAGLMSLSATAPTLPSGYTYKARIGWIRTDSSGSKFPLSFKQYGRKIQYVVASGSNLTAMPIMASGISGNDSTPTWSSVAWANYAPSTVAALNIMLACPTSGVHAAAAPNNSYGPIGSTTNPPPLQAGNSSSVTTFNTSVCDMVPESTNVYYASSAGTGATLSILGWTDNI